MLTSSADSSPLAIDAAVAASTIEEGIRRIVTFDLHRRGVVLGVSGGIDSAVCAALAARALGPERVTALLMPERESSSAGTDRGRALCAAFGIAPILEDVTGALEALGCYARRDEAIRRLFPHYGPGWRQKIGVAEGLLDHDRLNTFTLTVEAPDGERFSARLPADVYLAIVAATNLKQRCRKTVEYTHADALNRAVLGTPNRLEYALGFFVKGGDGLADLKPIAHLYKTQVYALAEHLGVPEDIRRQTPSTDTYTLPQTQEEFYYALPIDRLDRALFAFERGWPVERAAALMGLSLEQTGRVYRDLTRKRRVAGGLLREAARIGGDGEGRDAA
jgi:NAD+ synthase